MAEAVIVDAVRTPVGKGKPGGALSGVHPVDLHAHAIRALVERTGVDPSRIDDVISGAVGQVGEQSMNTARWAALAAGLPESVPAVTVDRQCGSSQQALHFAAQGVLAGAYGLVVASGVESMSRVPMGSQVASKDPFGTEVAQRYPEGLVPQGISAELIAARWDLSRTELDELAASSHERAAIAWKDGVFDREVVPLAGLSTDEAVRPGTTVDVLAGLRPAFRDEHWEQRFPQLDWRVTAGNSSPMSDGSAALLVASADTARDLGLTP
ncbi:MAG: acetyl-CoA acetyltransferase, partial [Chthonomonadaceae bacterium]|nr:acetyl-CoA acetyltransferase [Chthonomonadaceae bacterium]